jgi:hypothetical protein
MRVYPDSSVHLAVPLRKCYRPPTTRQVEAGIDNDAHTCFDRVSEHSISVLIEAIEVEMAVRINEHVLCQTG